MYRGCTLFYFRVALQVLMSTLVFADIPMLVIIGF